MREFDVELCCLQRTFGLHLRGLCRLQSLSTLIDNGVRDRLGLIQGQRAIEFTPSELRFGTRVRELAVRLQGDRFKGSGVDDIQEIAGIDESAVAKFDIRNESADPGANLNLFYCLKSAGELVPIRDRAFRRLCDRDGR